MKKLAFSALAGLAGLAALHAQPALAADDEVVVGFAASYSGWMQAYSGPPTNAAIIAIEAIEAVPADPLRKWLKY